MVKTWFHRDRQGSPSNDVVGGTLELSPWSPPWPARNSKWRTIGFKHFKHLRLCPTMAMYSNQLHGHESPVRHDSVFAAQRFHDAPAYTRTDEFNHRHCNSTMSSWDIQIQYASAKASIPSWISSSLKGSRRPLGPVTACWQWALPASLDAGLKTRHVVPQRRSHQFGLHHVPRATDPAGLSWPNVVHSSPSSRAADGRIDSMRMRILNAIHTSAGP